MLFIFLVPHVRNFYFKITGLSLYNYVGIKLVVKIVIYIHLMMGSKSYYMVQHVSHVFSLSKPPFLLVYPRLQFFPFYDIL